MPGPRRYIHSLKLRLQCTQTGVFRACEKKIRGNIAQESAYLRSSTFWNCAVTGFSNFTFTFKSINQLLDYLSAWYNMQNMFQLTSKLKKTLIWSMIYPLPIFHKNPPTTFWVIMQIRKRNKQINRQVMLIYCGGNSGSNETPWSLEIRRHWSQ